MTIIIVDGPAQRSFPRNLQSGADSLQGLITRESEGDKIRLVVADADGGTCVDANRFATRSVVHVDWRSRV